MDGAYYLWVKKCTYRDAIVLSEARKTLYYKAFMEVHYE